MDLSLHKPLGCALLLFAAVPSAPAQQNILLPPNSPNNPLISNPDADAVHRANAFMPGQSLQIFNAAKAGPSFDILPGAQQNQNYTSPEQTKAWEKFLETKKNWTLMTPEEILGVPTPEKILGVPDPDDIANLSPEDKFLKRLSAKEHADSSATNSTRPFNAAFQSDNSNPFLHHTENVFRPTSELDNNHVSDPNQDPYGNHRSLGMGVFQNPTLELEAQREAQANPLFNSPFAPPPQVEIDPAQVAAMERFRAFLNPPQPSAAQTTTYGQTPAPHIDPNMQVMPAFNPAGNSFTPLPSISSEQPSGLKPLAGPETRLPQPAPVKPAWAPKLPPWMSKEQSLQNPPQRVF